MGSQPDIIELNGREYDAKTGRIIPKSAHSKPASHAKPTSSGVSLDGFTKKPKAAHPTKAHTKASHAKAVHNKTSKSKTLMRGAIHRPPATAIQGAFEHQAQVRSSRVKELDAQREARAKAVHKSKRISKFSFSDTVIKPTIAHLPVKQGPKAEVVPAAKQPVAAQHAAAHSKTKIEVPENATAHLQPKLKKPRLNHRVARKLRITPRTLNVVTACFALVLIAGFIAYQNVPYVAVKLAATRAGVNASMPSYQPAGFGLTGHIQYQPGQVSYAYKAHTDDRNFTVTQAKSAWNSDALVENYVAKYQPYITREDKGKTIYIYDGSNATWVSGGVWYRIEGNSSLNMDQIVGLASSM